MNVTREQLTHIPSGTGIRFCADASTLGLAPGQWPTRLPTTMGNGLDFVRTRTEADGQIVVYAQANGMIDLLVFND